MSRAAAPLTISEGQREVLETLVKSQSAAHRVVQRAQALLAEIVDLTLHSKPEGQTHWSCRSMAKQAGVSSATVARIWSARGLKPHLVKTVTLCNDRHFQDKLIDVVGLYLNPPDQAVVLCMEEKKQIQALDRTQPSLPLKRG